MSRGKIKIRTFSRYQPPALPFLALNLKPFHGSLTRQAISAFHHDLLAAFPGGLAAEHDAA